MAIPDHLLDDIRTHFRLAEVVGRHVRLTRHGREYQGLCPFHKEKTPSFTVNEQKGFYHCFGCGAHGSLFDFVMAIEGVSFRDAVGKLAVEAGIALPVDTPRQREADDQRQRLFAALEAATACFERQLATESGKAARDYLANRGVSEDSIRKFRLGFADASGTLRAELTRGGFTPALLVEVGLLIQPDAPDRSPYDRFRGRLMFPIADRRGRTVGFGGRLIGAGEPKYLNSPETPLFHKGSLLYGLHHAEAAARQTGRIIAVEGYMDVIGLHAAGFAETVAPLGTAVTAEQLRLLWRLAPLAILCFDQDAAGQRAAARAIERVLPLIRAGNELKIALLKTDTGDDPDQVARRYPRQFLAQAFADAMALSDFIYILERGGHAPRSAEEAAALEQRLVRRTAAVTDPELRQHFRLAFRERVRRDLRVSRPPARGSKRGPPARAAPNGGLPDVRLATIAHPPAASGRWIEAEKHLLALILAHPADFLRHEEALGTLTFADAGFEHLRQALISILSSTETPTINDLRSRLVAAGCAEALRRVLEDPGVRLAVVNTESATVGDRDEYAHAQIALLRRRTIAEELAGAAGFQTDFADEWARRQALIRARLDSEER